MGRARCTRTLPGERTARAGEGAVNWTQTCNNVPIGAITLALTAVSDNPVGHLERIFKLYKRAVLFFKGGKLEFIFFGEIFKLNEC